MEDGYCCLCGTFGRLTFEHVPPRSSFNKKTRYQEIPILDFIKSKNPLDQGFKNKIEQGGIGYYSLCSKCNSFLGREYVNSFTTYSNSFIEFARKNEFNYFELEMHQFKAARVLKQVGAMFASINGWQFTQSYPEFRNYLLDVNSRTLPAQFRFFIYINIEGNLRNLPISVTASLKSTQTIMVSELTFPPMGHVMTIDFEGELPHLYEITKFKDFTKDETPSILFKVNKLATYLPFPLDYRSKSLIADTIARSTKL